MLKKILCGATLLCAATLANANTITIDETIGFQNTNFITSVSFADFDTLGGNRTLTGVSFSVTGEIAGDAFAENLSTSSSSTITTNLSGNISLLDLSGNLLVVTLPDLDRTFEASVFDGTIDYVGSSGVTYEGLFASASDSTDLLAVGTTLLTLADFTDGLANNFSVSAMAASIARGTGGNLRSEFETVARAFVSVTYTYEDTPSFAVSSPSNVALLGLGLLAIAGVRRSRK